MIVVPLTVDQAVLIRDVLAGVLLEAEIRLADAPEKYTPADYPAIVAPIEAFIRQLSCEIDDSAGHLDRRFTPVRLQFEPSSFHPLHVSWSLWSMQGNCLAGGTSVSRGEAAKLAFDYAKDAKLAIVKISYEGG